MKIVKTGDYRANLAKYHKKVLLDHEPLRISPGENGDVVIVCADDYENLKEAIYILKDKVTMQSLLRISTELKAGTYKGKSIGEIFGDVMDNRD